MFEYEFCPADPDSFVLVDDGTLDTVLSCVLCGAELRFLDTSDYRDEDGTLDVDQFVTDMFEAGELNHEIVVG